MRKRYNYCQRLQRLLTASRCNRPTTAMDFVVSFFSFPSPVLFYMSFFPSPFFLTPTPILMLPFPYFFLFLLFPIILFELKRFISAQQPKQVSRLRIERNIKENVGRDVERERESGRWGRMRGGGITRVRRER